MAIATSTAIIGAAVAGGVASSMAADKQAGAAKKAAKASSDAARYQTDIQKEMYDQTRQDQEPWRQTGQNALSALSFGAGLSSGYTPGGAQTEQQLREQMLSQYTSAGAPKTSAGGDWQVVSNTPPGAGGIEGQASSQPGTALVQNRATGETRQIEYGGSGAFLGTTARDLQGAMEQLGASSMGGQGIVDEAGLSAAIQRRMAEQAGATQGLTNATGIGQGSLLRPFSMADYEADPGYAFRQSEGQKAIERSAAARGGLLSGSALKGIERYGQSLASEEYGNAYNRFTNNQDMQFNRLAGLAGVGQTANNALQQAGSNFANAMTGISANNAANQGNALMAAGNARASGYQGIANAAGGLAANWPQQQQGYQVPAGYNMGSGYLGNAAATSQGYQPLNHAAANAGYYD